MGKLELIGFEFYLILKYGDIAGNGDIDTHHEFVPEPS
jgi:hypothetical protein